MRERRPHYVKGEALAVCDRCGFTRLHSALRKEWSGLMVCGDCWDPRPAEMTPPTVYPEGLPVRNPRPEPEPQFIDLNNPVRAEDL